MGAFRSIGSVTTGFNTAVTPGAPPGAQAGDILVAGFFCHAGTPAAPDLSAYGFTQKSDNSIVKAVVLYTKTAVGADAMPSANFGGDFQGCVCAAYTGLTETLDQASVARGGTTVANLTFPGFSTPPSSNAMAIALAFRNNATATGVSISNYLSFIQRATNIPNSNGRPVACFEDWSSPTGNALGAQTTSPADSIAQTNGTVLIFLQSIVIAGGQPVGESEYQAVLPRYALRPVHEFWQVPIALQSTPVASIPPGENEFPFQVLRARSNVQLSIEQSMPRPLVGQDRVLTPVDWQYGWDPSQLTAALQWSGQGLDASDMTNLTNYAPYQEYNWPVPPGPRQWLRGWESSINLSLLGKDKILTTGPNNLQWDPPPGPRQPIANRSFEQGGLALFYTVLTPPPGDQWTDLPPLAAKRNPQDFTAGVPETILTFLTAYPPFAPSVDLPPAAKRFPSVLRGFEWSIEALLRGQDVVPFGLKSDAPNPVRVRFNGSILSIEETTQFLIPITPPFPPGPGVRHMGRVLLDPARVGESVIVPMDFISGLGQNERPVSGSCTATTYSGTDINPQAIVTGAMSFDGSRALQRVTPPTVGVIYTLLYKVLTNQGNALELAGYFAVEPILP